MTVVSFEGNFCKLLIWTLPYVSLNGFVHPDSNDQAESHPQSHQLARLTHRDTSRRKWTGNTEDAAEPPPQRLVADDRNGRRLALFGTSGVARSFVAWEASRKGEDP